MTMTNPTIQARSSAADTKVDKCPSCQSALTIAKNPDADSYRRCTRCGEVWNVSRMKDDRHGGSRWR